MAIFIRCNKERAVKLAAERHGRRAKHLVKTWNDAELKHCFEGRKEFRKALRRNQKALESRGKKLRERYEEFFVPKNLRFSTNADCREETLYFEDAHHRTGRLRQQHGEGPLAKIDHDRRMRLFLSEDRFNTLKKWHIRNKEKLPTFYPDELKVSDGTRLIEFARRGVIAEEWHESGGIVSTSKKGSERRIRRSLHNILGIPV